MKKNKIKNPKILEAKRQTFHAVVGLAFVIFFYYNIIPIWLFFVIAVTSIIIYISYEIRRQEIFDWFLRHFGRENEKNGKGAVWYLLGCSLTFLIFPKNIALAGVMILALGDSLSHYIGRFYSYIPHPLNKKKNIEGTIFGILAGFAGASFFVPVTHAIIASFVAMNLEAIEWKYKRYKIDDNLLLPLAAATVLYILSLL